MIDAPCRRFQKLRLDYAGVEFIRTINQDGRLEITLDCIGGNGASAEFIFADESRESRKISGLDLDRVTKIAVIWSAPVNLDLHAFEYSAPFQSPDHIWAGAPSSDAEARAKIANERRGHGFMSTVSTGAEQGVKLEVYTFWHSPGQKSGVINLALDYESRADPGKRDAETCGTGLYADLEYQAILIDRNAAPKRFYRKFASLDCSVTLSGLDRYNPQSVPEIVIRN